MIELLPVVGIGLILAWLSARSSVYDHSLERYTRKDPFFYAIMAVIMAVFVGLRTKFNDTTAYTHAYELIVAEGSVLSAVDDWSIGANPGFKLINGVMAHLGMSTQSFLMIYALVTVLIYLWFVRKYTNNIWLSLFLFIAMGCYTFTMAAIKQCVAVALCLLATDRAIQKKWVSFVLWVLLAMTFHPYSVMYLIVPLLMFRTWSAKTYQSLVIFGLAGVLLQTMLGTIVDITGMLGEEYSVESFSGDGVNPFRLAVCAVPLIISYMAKDHIAAMDEKQERVYFMCLNLSILNAEIMFVGLFGTANYFARLANYFLIFQCLSIPWLLQFFEKKSRQFMAAATVVCYFLYFYYSNVINRNFDALFKRVTLWEYLQSLF